MKENNWKELSQERHFICRGICISALGDSPARTKTRTVAMLSEKGHRAPAGDVLLAGWPSRDLHKVPVAVNWHMPATTKTLPSHIFQPVKLERE